MKPGTPRRNMGGHPNWHSHHYASVQPRLVSLHEASLMPWICSLNEWFEDGIQRKVLWKE